MKSVPGYERYKIDKQGNVYSYADRHCGRSSTAKKLKGEVDKDGYIKYVLYNNGKRKKFLAHRLMAMTYLDNTHNKDQVNHKNGIKDDNRIENLEWVTACENRQHAYDIGLQSQLGEKNNNSKLNRSKVVFIKSNNHNLSKKQLADIFNVSKSLIHLVMNGERWGHI